MTDDKLRLAQAAQAQSLGTILGTSLSVTIVDVGANPIDGAPPYAPLLANGVGRVVGFEADKDALAKLNQAKGPNETYLPYAVGDGQRHRLKLCAAPGFSSLLEPNPALALIQGFADWGRVVATEAFDTVRLDDIPQTLGLDFLKIDVNGAELMVFENALDRLSKAVVIHTEVEFLPIYVGAPLFSDIDVFLRKLGFVLHKFCPLNSRAIKPLAPDNNIYAGFGQLIWADAVFIRDFTKMQSLTADQMLKIACIMHDCYRAHDLVLHFLSHYDRLSSTEFANKYVDHIAVKP